MTASAVAPTAIPIGSAIDGTVLGDGEADGISAVSKFVYADERGKLVENFSAPTTFPVTVYAPFVHVTSSIIALL